MATANERVGAESVAALAAQAVAADPKLQNRVKRMVEKMVDNVAWTMAFGTSQDKAALMKAVVPAMVRSMTSVESDQQEKRAQEAYDRIREAVGGEA